MAQEDSRLDDFKEEEPVAKVEKSPMKRKANNTF